MTATANGHLVFPGNPAAAAALYLQRGLAPISLPSRSKGEGLQEGWQHQRLTAEVLSQHFPPKQALNIGVLNGEPSSNHLDVDLDCPEAIAAAPFLLPSTGWIFGRKTAQRSHWIYHADQSLGKAQLLFTDIDRAKILELRGTGGMTVYPPSLHKETGEQISWDSFTEPAGITLDNLQRVVKEVAAAALLARHWPGVGDRDNAAMALAGGLLRAGWEVEEVERFIEAVAVAAKDEQVRMRLTKPRDTAEKLKQGEHVTGWPTLAKLLGKDGEPVVKQVREWLGLISPKPTWNSAEPLPIPEAPPWPEPPGQEAFEGLPGRIVAAIEPASEADRSALLIQALVCFGNIIGHTAHFVVEGTRHHANEFAALVGRTSKARKGTSWGRIYGLMSEAESVWAENRVQTGASSGEGIIWAVRDPIDKQEKVKDRGQPVRYETVQADPGVEDKRLLVYEPEFANVLKQTERQGNTLSVILRQLWDGSSLRTLTKNSPAKATGAHGSLIGHITVEELHRYLTQTESANGFGNRFLWICTDRSKLLPEGGRIEPNAWEQVKQELIEALMFARNAEEIRRDDEARTIWCDIYGELSEGKPGLAGALLARGEAHVMRLAMIYALMDRSCLIQERHLLAALALWDYAERSVHHIFGDSLGDPVADEVLRLLRNSPEGVTRNELMDYFGRHQSSERIGRALGLLLQHHIAQYETQDTGGRPSERWFAVSRGTGK
jgi:hypothetical protein